MVLRLPTVIFHRTRSLRIDPWLGPKFQVVKVSEKITCNLTLLKQFAQNTKLITPASWLSDPASWSPNKIKSNEEIWGPIAGKNPAVINFWGLKNSWWASKLVQNYWA